MATKYYLDQEGVERLVSYLNSALDNKMDKGDIEIPDDIVREADLADYAKKNEVVESLPNDLVYLDDLNSYVLASTLNDYVQSSALDAYATAADLARVEGMASGVYHYMGSVANLAALQAIENPSQGDVYNLEDTGINAAWTGSEWDQFGSIVDLSPYALAEDIQAITRATLNEILYSGKSAIVTDSEGIASMVDNDEPEVQITLNKNVAVPSTIAVPAGKTVTVDLGGNKITCLGSTRAFDVTGGDLVLTNGEVTTVGRSVYVSSGSLTLDDDVEITSTTDVAITATGANTEIIMNDGKVTAQESGILVTTGATLEMNGGEIECIDNCPIQGNGTAGQGDINVVMNGGRLVAHIQTAGYTACAVYMPNSGSFTMNGGEIISDGCGICMRAGEVNLNGGSVVSNGPAGFTGKVGDSRVVVGSYAVVYDQSAKYPAADTLELNIGENMLLAGTDGQIQTLLASGATANINDSRVQP